MLDENSSNASSIVASPHDTAISQNLWSNIMFSVPIMTPAALCQCVSQQGAVSFRETINRLELSSTTIPSVHIAARCCLFFPGNNHNRLVILSSTTAAPPSNQ